MKMLLLPIAEGVLKFLAGDRPRADVAGYSGSGLDAEAASSRPDEFTLLHEVADPLSDWIIWPAHARSSGRRAGTRPTVIKDAAYRSDEYAQLDRFPRLDNASRS